jgi:hypothetical protein
MRVLQEDIGYLEGEKQTAITTAQKSGCSVAGCSHLAATFLETSPLCLEHFFSASSARLEGCTQFLEDRPLRETDARLVWQFVLDCAKGADNLLHRAADLPLSEQRKLVEILLGVEATKRRLRRSERKTASIRVLLRRNQPGPSREEKAETQNLSRYGALLNCSHPVRVGGFLTLVREDTKREARVRVMWCKLRDNRRYEIGIGFVDSENFWQLDWSNSAEVF